ncbi:MAG: hypothetical protein ABL963_15060 [Longimicrobiales bacterium]
MTRAGVGGIGRFGGLLALVLGVSVQGVEGQSLSYSTGQTVSPAYEGFEVNPDGSYNLIFGYLNRNWLEELDVPVGEDNFFSPGPADRGQPTHFLPRRNRFTFKVQVPADFGDQELVWTLRTRGETKVAYASLRQDLLIDNIVIASETGALGAGRSDPETRSNVPPQIMLDGPRTVNARVGQPVTLSAWVTDDGLPLTTAQRRERARAARQAATPAADPAQAAAAPASDTISAEMRALQRAFTEPDRVTVSKALGLHFTWFVYRGEAEAEFEPIQIKPWEDTRAWQNSPWAPFWEAPEVPEDNHWVVRVTFDEPGTYVLRGRADDGSLYADQEVTVNVAPLAN